MSSDVKHFSQLTPQMSKLLPFQFSEVIPFECHQTLETCADTFEASVDNVDTFATIQL